MARISPREPLGSGSAGAPQVLVGEAIEAGLQSIYVGGGKVNPSRQAEPYEMSAPRENAMTEADVQACLSANLPEWRLEDGWIRRTYKTNSWKGTLMVINTIGHLAEAAWHHPDITASYAWVEVRLMTHSAKGITDKDLFLAKKIEDVIQWQPATETDNSLEGTPKDPRFAYIKYD
jgi:4a-hydroxytetrahydrobiopterin dehydratase